jgi:UDP-2,3-diacylglucosamine hydrolase
VGLYRCVHPDIGIPLASWFSRWSRQNPPDRHYDEAYIAFARQKFSIGYDAVILGHTHRPQEFREGRRTYINIGDWMHTFTYGKMEKGRLTLQRWE